MCISQARNGLPGSVDGARARVSREGRRPRRGRNTVGRPTTSSSLAPAINHRHLSHCQRQQTHSPNVSTKNALHALSIYTLLVVFAYGSRWWFTSGGSLATAVRMGTIW